MAGAAQWLVESNERTLGNLNDWVKKNLAFLKPHNVSG
jgi:hypothetical protein